MTTERMGGPAEPWFIRFNGDHLREMNISLGQFEIPRMRAQMCHTLIVMQPHISGNTCPDGEMRSLRADHRESIGLVEFSALCFRQVIKEQLPRPPLSAVPVILIPTQITQRQPPTSGCVIVIVSASESNTGMVSRPSGPIVVAA